MNQKNQKIKSKFSVVKKIIVYVFLLTFIILIYLSSTEKKANGGFSTVLYSGEGKIEEKVVPSKLNWFDSFKGINNMNK